MVNDELGALPRPRGIRVNAVMHITGASRPTIWRWAKFDPTFPKPFHLSRAITCWDEQEIYDWVASKKAGSR